PATPRQDSQERVRGAAPDGAWRRRADRGDHARGGGVRERWCRGHPDRPPARRRAQAAPADCAGGAGAPARGGDRHGGARGCSAAVGRGVVGGRYWLASAGDLAPRADARGGAAGPPPPPAPRVPRAVPPTAAPPPPPP